MISKKDTDRIKDDALIAMDALQAILHCTDLHESYALEKAYKAKRCIEFIISIAEEKDE